MPLTKREALPADPADEPLKMAIFDAINAARASGETTALFVNLKAREVRALDGPGWKPSRGTVKTLELPGDA